MTPNATNNYHLDIWDGFCSSVYDDVGDGKTGFGLTTFFRSSSSNDQGFIDQRLEND